MNTFGRLFRISIFGESHGEETGVTIDGCPAGLNLHPEDFREDLDRRRPGQPGTTARKEADTPQIRAGILNGKTTGAPLLIAFQNSDTRPEDYRTFDETPRPGHADFVAQRRFGGFNDPRGGGHFSGRLTVGLVAAGVVAKKVLRPVRVEAVLLEAGGIQDAELAVRSALQDKDSIGGIVECRTEGLPVGLGEPFFDPAESLLSHLVFAVPGIRGIEFGSGFACTGMRGSVCNDAIMDTTGRTRTNHAGGINGGLTNGNPVVFRVAVKPPSSIGKVQRSVDLKSGDTVDISIAGRHDACIALRMPVIIEAAAAVVFTDMMLTAQKRPRLMEKNHES